MNRGVFILAILLLGLSCRNKGESIFQNDFIKIPILENMKFGEFSTNFSDECVSIIVSDTVIEYTVCEINRHLEKGEAYLLDSVFAYVPVGHFVSHQAAFNKFGSLSVNGRMKILQNKKDGEERAVYVSKLRSDQTIIGIIRKDLKPSQPPKMISAVERWEKRWKLIEK